MARQTGWLDRDVLFVSGSTALGSQDSPAWVTGTIRVENPSDGGGIVSGSVGILVGGTVVDASNPLPVTGSIFVLNQFGGSVAVSSVAGTVTVAAHSITSGSVTGLLVGGQAVSSTNAVPVALTSSVTTTAEMVDNTAYNDTTSRVVPAGYVLDESTAGGTSLSENDVGAARIDGKRAQVFAIEDRTTRGQRAIVGTNGALLVQGASGSVVGLQVGGVDHSQANPIWVSGTVRVENPGGAGSNVTAQSGSVTGLLVGGVAASAANPLPTTITGSSVLFSNGSAVSSTNPMPTSTIQGYLQAVSGSAIQTVWYASGDYTASGSANQVIAPQGAGVGIAVLSLQVMTIGNNNIRFVSTGSAGTINNISGKMPLPASGGLTLQHNPHGWFRTRANEGLNLSLDGAGNVGITLTWMKVGG